LDNQLTFVGKLQDSLNTGVGNLVDADVAKESANLQALQVKQQLSAQALSIANSAPQIVLSLFK
jgi:flagellin